MITQVLIIHGQLPFAIKLKQSLERSAPVEAHPFTSVEAALDYLNDHVQDAALVDFAIADFPGAAIVQGLREVQPELAIIATPHQSDEDMNALDLLASLDQGFSARDLINTMNAYFAQNQRPSYSPPATTALLARAEKDLAPQQPDDLPEYSSLDNVLGAVGTNIFEAEGDTPRPDAVFEEVLNTLPPDTPPASNNPFTDLVNSMRSEDQHQSLPSRQQRFVEFILTGGMDPLLQEIERSQDEPKSIFERLAEEEPPLPTFEESGTISDLISGVSEKSFHNVISILRGEEVSEDSDTPVEALPSAADFVIERPFRPEAPPRPTEEFDFDEPPTPAKVILQRTLEQTLSGGEFSLEELLANIEQQLPMHRPKVQPLPSWMREHRQQDDVFLVREPDFLPEELPDEATPVEPSEEYPDQATQPARGQKIEAHPETLETEWLDSPERFSPDTIVYPDTLPEEIPFEATVQHEAAVWEDQDFNTQFEIMAAFEVADENGISEGALYTEVSMEAPPAEMVAVEPLSAAPEIPEDIPAEDPYIAQLALSLTEVSLELTAEATLLARDQQIIAYAGQMPAEEIEELRELIADDWNAASDEVRIRFITAQGSGKDYMLYSRRTEDDLTLSLIFGGTMPLRDIRRQGQRLVDALMAVPEAPTAEPEAPPPTQIVIPVETGPRTPYACVWLLRDPRAHLDQSVSQAIVAGLKIQLRENQWAIQDLQVQEDYVYLLADVPGEDPAYQLVRDLKRRSAEIAHAQNPAYAPDSLWADSYLVVTPGRELDIEEIQQFINFERMS